MEKKAYFFTNIFVRCLADFGNVINYLHRQGYSVTICTWPPIDTAQVSTYSPETTAEYQKLLPKSVKVEYLPYTVPYRLGKTTLPMILRTLLFTFRVGRRNPEALYILWGGSVNVACGLPLRFLNRKCLYMVTGLGTVLGSRNPRVINKVRLARFFLMNAYRYALRGRNSRCLNHNGEDKKFLAAQLKVEPEKFFVTPGCGVDPKVFTYFESLPGNERKIILVPARLVEEKGILEVAKASSILRARGLDHEVWFTGTVEPFIKYRFMKREGCTALSQEDCDRLQRENPCVKFVGYHLSLIPLYEKCDIVCVPSRYPEGTPTALIEAAACGRPAVTCDTVGCREIIVKDVTGLVVPQADPVALANALQRYITDPVLCERMRRSAYQHFLAGYTKDEALRRTVEALESLGFPFSGERIAPDVRVLNAH